MEKKTFLVIYIRKDNNKRIFAPVDANNREAAIKKFIKTAETVLGEDFKSKIDIKSVTEVRNDPAKIEEIKRKLQQQTTSVSKGPATDEELDAFMKEFGKRIDAEDAQERLRKSKFKKYTKTGDLFTNKDREQFRNYALHGITKPYEMGGKRDFSTFRKDEEIPTVGRRSSIDRTDWNKLLVSIDKTPAYDELYNTFIEDANKKWKVDIDKAVDDKAKKLAQLGLDRELMFIDYMFGKQKKYKHTKDKGRIVGQLTNYDLAKIWDVSNVYVQKVSKQAMAKLLKKAAERVNYPGVVKNFAEAIKLLQLEHPPVGGWQKFFADGNTLETMEI